MNPLRPRPALAAAAILVFAGCAGAAGPSPSAAPPSPGPSATPLATPAPSPTAAPAAVVLKVTSEGGFIQPSASLAALPAVVVFTDGRVITPGAVPALYPGPLLTPASVRSVGSDGLTKIVAAIRAAGLDRPATGGPGVNADSGASVFTVTLDGKTTVTRFAANGPGGPGAPGGGADPGKAAALDLLNRLTDPTVAWGAAPAPGAPYEATGFRVFVAPGAPAADPSVVAPPLAWPLATPLDAFGTPAQPDRGIAGLRSGVVVGADATALAPVLAKASQLTAFTSGGHAFTLYVRPLLPDELATP